MFKNLEQGLVFSPKYFPNNFGVNGTLKHTTYNLSKTMIRGSGIVGGILETPDIVNGIIEDQGFGRNATTQTAGAIGSIFGGMWLGSKAGALASSYSGNPWVIAGAAVGGGIIGGAVGESAAEAFIQSIPSPSASNRRRDVVLHKR